MKTMTRKIEDDVDVTRVAELELENDELKQRLAQREHDTAKIVDEMDAAQRNGGGPTMQANTALALLWGFISAWLLTFIFAPESFVAGLMGFLMVGFGFVFVEKWIRAERSNGLGVLILKCIVLAFGLFAGVVIIGGGKIITNDGNAHDHPVLALFWISFVMLVALSKFCEWLAQGIAAFVDDPILTMRGWFVREPQEEGYDGRGEN